MRSVRASSKSGVMSDLPAPIPANWCCGVKYSTVATSRQPEKSVKRAIQRLRDCTLVYFRTNLYKNVSLLKLPVQDAFLDGGPNLRARIDEVEMPGAGRLNEFCIFGGFGEPLAHVEGNQLVRRAVHYPLRCGNRQKLHRRSGRIALGYTVGRAAQKLAHHSAVQLQGISAPQIRDSRKGPPAAQVNQLLRREPQRQLPSGRVSGRDHALQVQPVAVRQGHKVLGSANNVVRHAGPISTRIAQSTISQAPEGCAGASQGGAQVTGVIQA